MRYEQRINDIDQLWVDFACPFGRHRSILALEIIHKLTMSLRAQSANGYLWPVGKGPMWLVLQPILVIGMLCNDKLFVAAVMAALAARFTSRLHSELDPVFRRRTASQIKSHNRN